MDLYKPLRTSMRPKKVNAGITINFSKVTASKFLLEKLQRDEDLQELFDDFSFEREIDGMLYFESEILETKYPNGVQNAWLIWKTENNVFKIKMNISFDMRQRAYELYVKTFIPLHKNNNIVNGAGIRLVKTNAMSIPMNLVDVFSDAGGYLMQYQDTSDILRAIDLYRAITIELDKDSEKSLAVDKFSTRFIRRVDKQALNDIDIDTFVSAGGTYVYDADADRLPSKSVSEQILVLWELRQPEELPRSIGKTLRTIQSDDGISVSLKPDDWTFDAKTMKLIDSKVKHIDRKQSKLWLITTQDNLATELEHFIISDRLRHKKRDTMLRVVEDIKKDRINNNNLFQYLFNNGEYSMVTPIKGWTSSTMLVNKYSGGLYDRQKIAFNLATDNHPISFIQGPPGTGKTHTITQICKYYNSLGKNVLVSSQTNVAVENILENLWQDISFQDIAIKADYKNSYYSEGSMGERINEKLKSIFNIKNDIDLSSINLSTQYMKSNIVGSTTTSSAINSRSWNDFSKNIDVLIIDEISKSSVPELIRYVVNAKKIIFVGDQKQLAPLEEISQYDDVWDKYTEKDKKIIEEYISVSIFDKLYEEMHNNGRAVMLNINGRSLPSIMKTYAPFYRDPLVPKRKDDESKIVWKDNVKPYHPFTFMSMNGGSEKKDKSHSRYNAPEAKEVAVILEELSEKIANAQELTVAVITYYGAQKRKIKEFMPFEEISKKFKSIKVDTVDAFQGAQADIVILSTVRETKTFSTGFIDDFRRINVSISRAKDLVLMLGNDFLLKEILIEIDDKKIPYYSNILDMINEDRIEGYERPFIRRRVG